MTHLRQIRALIIGTLVLVGTLLTPRDAAAMECEELANMELAGVPGAAVVRKLDLAGTPVDLDFIRCLAERGVSLELVRAAWRLRAEEPQYTHPLKHDQSVRASSTLELDMMCGSVSVLGTHDSAVRIRGSGPEQSRLDVKETRQPGNPSGPVEGLQVSVEDARAVDRDDPAALPRFTREGALRPDVPRPCAHLQIEVPRDSRLVVTSARADVRIWFVGGPLELSSHFGDIEIVGRTDELVLRTTSGHVRADTASKHVDIETVSGMIELSAGEDARVALSTISGPIWVWGGPIRRIDASSVSGDIRMNASLADASHADLETHKGDVEVRAPDGDIVARSHEGLANGPAEMVRPDGFSQRHGRSVANGGQFERLDLLDAEVYGLWAKKVPERWWFRRGAVVSSVLSAPAKHIQLSARSFSGDVTVDTATRFPAPTGPLIVGLEDVGDRVDACVEEQRKRHPEAVGHAVLNIEIGEKGAVAKATAPAKAQDAAHVEDGRLSSCLVRAVDKRTFDAAPGTTIRWPVPFRQVSDPQVLETQDALQAWIEGSGSLRPDRRAPPPGSDGAARTDDERVP